MPNGNGLPNSFVLGTSEGPPTFVGDLHLYQPQRQKQQQEQLLLQQQQLQLLQQQELFPINNEPELERGTLAPLTNLFGFVPADQIHRYKPYRQPVETPPPLPIPGEPFNQEYQQYQEPIVPTTTTTTTQAPVKEEPVNNIEDAILEALFIAEGGTGQQTSAVQPVKQVAAPPPPPQPLPVKQATAPPPSLSQANANYQNLIDSGAIPGLQNNQDNGVIKVPSSFGDVFIHAEQQSTQNFHKGAVYTQNTRAPRPPKPAQVTQAPAPVQPQVVTVIPEIVFLNPYDPPAKNTGSANQVPNQRPAGAQLIIAASDILGSISTGSLGNIVQSTIKAAQVPAVQDTAKLATATILHNVFQGFNCNLLGNCNNRLMLPNLKKDKNPKKI